MNKEQIIAELEAMVEQWEKLICKNNKNAENIDSDKSPAAYAMLQGRSSSFERAISDLQQLITKIKEQ
jgi:exonuclease VII small subunit